MPTGLPEVMTDREVEEVRCQVDAIAWPLTFLSLMWLLENPDRSRTDGTHGPFGGSQR